MAEQYDVIIAGCGNNGLTVGCYLAKAGYSVLGIEQGERIGGGAMTRERIPGYKHDLYARNLRWLRMSPVYADLELEKYGVKFLHGDALNAHILADGRCIVRYADLEKTCAEIARFNKHDAAMYRQFYYDTAEMRKGIIRSYTRPPQVPFSRIGELAKTPEGQKLAYLQITSAINVIDRYFDDEDIRTWMYASANSFGSPPEYPATGLGVISFQMQLHDHPQVQVEGGASAVTDAMGKIITENGGKLLTGRAIKQILVKNGRATGVELDDGTQFEAKMLVVAGLGHRLLLDVVEHAAMGQEFTRNLELLKPEDHAVFGLHLALRQPPQYTAAQDNPAIQRTLFVHWGFGTRQEYEEHAQDEHQNRQPRHIGGTSYNMSNWDKTLAPPGHVVAGMLFGTSYRLGGDPNNWADYKEELGRRILERWREYAPNLTAENVVGYFCQSPADTVRDNPSFWEGSQMHIATLPDQTGAFRPFPGWSNYRTPVQGLYVASASCHPTGGVSGMPGYNAVNEIAKDFDIKTWWNRE
jgi:phytoene dehydrogenase-like protein